MQFRINYDFMTRDYVNKTRSLVQTVIQIATSTQESVDTPLTLLQNPTSSHVYRTLPHLAQTKAWRKCHDHIINVNMMPGIISARTPW